MRAEQARSLSVLVGVVVAVCGAAAVLWGAQTISMVVTGADSAGLVAFLIPFGFGLGVFAALGGLAVVILGVYLVAFGGKRPAGFEDGPV